MRRKPSITFAALAITFALAQTLQPEYLVPSQAGLPVGQHLRMVVISGDRTARNVIRRPPGSGENSGITWTSSNPAVARVDQLGNVVARKKGTAMISATIAGGSDSTKTRAPAGQQFASRASSRPARPAYALRSRIDVGVLPAELEAPETLSVDRYCAKQVVLRSSAERRNAVGIGPVTWSTDAPDIANVHALPLPATVGDLENVVPGYADVQSTLDALYFQRIAIVRGIAVGQATITVSVHRIEMQHIPVSVGSGGPTVIRISPESMELDVQESAQAHATVMRPIGCLYPDPMISWSISNTAVAKVDRTTGVVRGLNIGAADLTATAYGGETAPRGSPQNRPYGVT